MDYAMHINGLPTVGGHLMHCRLFACCPSLNTILHIPYFARIIIAQQIIFGLGNRKSQTSNLIQLYLLATLHIVCLAPL